MNNWKRGSVSIGKVWKKYKWGYLMLLPCLIFFGVFSYTPMAGLVVAFKDFSLAKGIFQSPWASSHGLQNFKNFFNYVDCWLLIRNTLVSGLVKVVLVFPFPIILALLLNEINSSLIKRGIQTISYLPYFLSWAVVSVMIFRILSPGDGMVNNFIQKFGFSGDTYFMMEESWFYPILFLAMVWKNIGWNSIVYLAAITGINPELYEAAKIDGAGRWKQTWHITLSELKPTMGILFIMGIGALVSSGFEQNYLLRTPGNMRLADTLDVFVVMQGFNKGKYAYATAIGFLQGITSLILVVLCNKLGRKFFDTSIW